MFRSFVINAKQKPWFGAMHLKEIITCATKIKIIASVVYSECVLKVGDSGHFLE